MTDFKTRTFLVTCCYEYLLLLLTSIRFPYSMSPIVIIIIIITIFNYTKDINQYKLYYVVRRIKMDFTKASSSSSSIYYIKLNTINNKINWSEINDRYMD